MLFTNNVLKFYQLSPCTSYQTSQQALLSLGKKVVSKCCSTPEHVSKPVHMRPLISPMIHSSLLLFVINVKYCRGYLGQNNFQRLRRRILITTQKCLNLVEAQH